MSNLKLTIEESFEQYAGAVLQSRALVDVRDCLKPSARQIFYSMLERKLIYSKPYKKTANAVGMAMADYYIHGDSSAEGVIMRAGQQFAMRYPLVSVKGNAGSLIASGNWAASRYTESRLSKLSSVLFEDIDKDTISEWRDNYDNTKQYPVVLPSKGYYNIVNPTMGIGIGAACSIPGFNLNEVNEALIKLLWNPDISFEEIYCAPDFPTGATLLNENEVKESLKNGCGKSCKLRATVDYDSSENALVVTEIPYGVYTNTICGELENILNNDADNPGIDRFNDLTGITPLIKIYLKKKANPSRIIKYLYKNTSLQSYYGINMTMLENGRYPKVFTWKEALQSHINHEIEVYTKGFEHDLKKIEHRIHVIEGLLICLASIEEVVQTIKSSPSTAAASSALQSQFLLDEVQAKAVLDMKLSRLAHLEVEKLKKEKTELEESANKIRAILNDEKLLKLEIENGFKQVAKEFGDARRTTILNIEGEEDEIVEQKNIQISLTNKNNLLVSEVSSLYTQKRGGTGTKIKMDKGEYIISTVAGTTTDTLMVFSAAGNAYNVSIRTLEIDGKNPVESIIKVQDNEKFCALATTAKKTLSQNIIFFTKKGIIKKSKLSEYSTTRMGSLKAITLDANDEICSVLIMNDERVGMMTKLGQFIMVETKDITAIGRIAKGRKGMNINDGDELICACVIPKETKELLSITKEGFTKRTSINEFNITSLNTKGIKIQKLKTNTDEMVEFLPVNSENNLLIVSSKTQIKLSMGEISLLGRGAMGTKSMKIADNIKIVGISLS